MQIKFLVFSTCAFVIRLVKQNACYNVVSSLFAAVSAEFRAFKCRANGSSKT